MKFFLIFLGVIFCVGCSGVSEEDILRYRRSHQAKQKSLDRSHVDLLLYRTKSYSSSYNDLTSWANSQRLFANVCRDYLGIPKESISVMENDTGVGLLSYLETYRGESLIVYFSSHLESNGKLILSNGRMMPVERLAEALNKLRVNTLLIFDTCYARKLKRLLRNSKVSVVYTGNEDEKVFDMRVKGQKPTLNKLCKHPYNYSYAVWGLDVRDYSPFGILFLKAFLEADKGETLVEGLEQVVRYNEEIRQIVGMKKYPRMCFSLNSYWRNFKLK